MNTIELLAIDVIKSIDHLEDDEWEHAASAVHQTLILLHKHGYTSENVSELLTKEYTRWNEMEIEDFLK